MSAPCVKLALKDAAWQVSGDGIAPANFPLPPAGGPGRAAPQVPDELVEHVQRHRQSAKVHASVGAAWARAFVMPFSPLLVAEARWMPFAQSRFEQLYGESAGPWELRWLVERPRHPRLAAAIPCSTLQAVRDAFKGQLVDVSVESVSRVQALRAEHPRFTGAMCELGASHAVVTLLRHGVPQRVRLRRAKPDAHMLGALLKTEWAALATQVAGIPSEVGHVAWSSSEPMDDADRSSLGSLASHVVRVP